MTRCEAEGVGVADALGLGVSVPPPDGLADGLSEGVGDGDSEGLAEALAVGEFEATLVDEVQPPMRRIAAARPRMRMGAYPQLLSYTFTETSAVLDV
jgi:hypothetical protein